MSVCLNDTDGDGDCAACARNPRASCRVSARDAVHHLFESGRTSCRLDAYLDAYAHELAEKQRAVISDDIPAWVKVIPDLIDPEVP
ncbi:hypothetical protein ACF1DV_25885 [Streptomyces achromogenes]|uniref:hypothetical protein n=1 Tax=Streptomyces achromogenes TaxID=67255 RepID=UPI003701BFF3